MTDLDRLLNENFAPAPRAGLADDIFSAAEKNEPANDRPPRQARWWVSGGVAAIAVLAAFLVIQPGNTLDESEAEHWEQVAENSGFSDLHDWVEGDGS